MSVTDTTEKRFESDIEEFFLSDAGGYSQCTDEYDPKLGLYKDTLIRFIKDSQLYIFRSQVRNQINRRRR